MDVKHGSVTKETGSMKVRVIMNKYSCSDHLLLPNKSYGSEGSVIIGGSNRKRRLLILPMGHKASTGHMDLLIEMLLIDNPCSHSWNLDQQHENHL